MAEDQRVAIPRGEAVDFLDERGDRVLGLAGRADGWAKGRRIVLNDPPPRRIRSRPRRQPSRHAEQPGPERGPVPNPGRATSQDEERRLKRVLGVGLRAGDGAADAQDHRRMPRHDRLERRLRRIAPAEEHPQ